MRVAIAAAVSLVLSAATCTSAFAESYVQTISQPAIIAQPVVTVQPVVTTQTFAATYPAGLIYSSPVMPDCKLPNGMLYAGIYTQIDAHGYMWPYGI
ncbi:MAG TPA: hypothetical protein V6D22_20035 [Candidatus Obscuribacterales bacterium]